MLNKICIYNNKLFLALDYNIIAYCYCKYPKSDDEKFVECFKIKLPVNFCSILDIKLDVIHNKVTGLKSLLILVFDTSKQWSIFIYNNAFRKKLHQIILPSFSLGNENDLFISDGPSFLFHSKDTFQVCLLPYCFNNSFDFKFLLSDYEEYKILQFKCFGPFKSSCQQYLLLLILSCNFSSQQSIKILGCFSDKKKPSENFEQLSINVFFPQCYETILKAVEITKVSPAGLLHVKDMECKDTASVICTENECLIISNGSLQYCCKLTLPLTNVMSMKIDYLNTKIKNLVLTLENKSVFFMAIKRNNNLEVVKEWTNIEATVVGDILMNGTKQVLLLKQTDLNSWQNDTIFYDMSSFMSIDILCHSSLPDTCLKTTISAMERKVQAGNSAIKDLEFEISQKSAATIDALIKLNEYRVNTESLKSSCTFQQSLVDLILSKDENKIEAAVAESSVKLLEKRHRFMNNKWIISLCFLNENERCICYPNIKILKRNNQLACIQKLFVCSSDDNFLPSEYVREIDAKTKFYVVLVLEYSVFQMEDDIFLILSWYNGSTDEFNNEIFIKEDRKVLSQNQISLQTRITLSDILKHSIQKGNFSPSDLLFIRALQQRTNLCVSSLHSDISRFEDILMKSNSTASCLHLFENSSAKCVVFSSENSVLFGVHFIIVKSLHNNIEIGAFSRNRSELCLLVHYLYQHLPKDVMISPCVKFKDECTEIKKNIAISMKDEVDLLISSFNVHNIPEEMRKSHIKLMSSQTVGTLTIPKITYHRIRKVLVKKECITDTLFKNIS